MTVKIATSISGGRENRNSERRAYPSKLALSQGCLAFLKFMPPCKEKCENFSFFLVLYKFEVNSEYLSQLSKGHIGDLNICFWTKFPILPYLPISLFPFLPMPEMLPFVLQLLIIYFRLWPSWGSALILNLLKWFLDLWSLTVEVGLRKRREVSWQELPSPRCCLHA